VAVRDAATEVLETVADLLMHAAREVDMARDAGYRRRYELVSLHLQTALSLVERARTAISRAIEEVKRLSGESEEGRGSGGR
jgi:hypothetical protein